MSYDLKLAQTLCKKLGFPTSVISEYKLDISICENIIFSIQNDKNDDNSLITLQNSEWHSHDPMTFVDKSGKYISLNYLDILEGLASGVILIREDWINGLFGTRWLIHRDYNDLELEDIEPNNEIRIRRAITQSV